MLVRFPNWQSQWVVKFLACDTNDDDDGGDGDGDGDGDDDGDGDGDELFKRQK